MQIAIGQSRSEEVVVIGLAVGVMVAMYPPHLRLVDDTCQFLLEREFRLDVAKQHHRVGAQSQYHFLQMAKAAMGIAGEEYRGLLSHVVILQCE